MTDRILLVILLVLGVLAMLCVGGIIALSYAQPARSIPDILVATTSVITTGIVGLMAVLVPSPTRRRGVE